MPTARPGPLTRATLGCAVALLACSCSTGGTAAGGTTAGTPSAAPAASGGGAALLAEVRHELTTMRTTHYQHRTDVNAARGSFDYDCSGMLDHALETADPAALRALPVTTSTRPLAADVEHTLAAAPTDGSGAWQAVPTVAQLRPGDVVSWLATEDSTTGDTGHVMVVAEAPRPDQRHGDGALLVTVIDSTINPHGHDTRRRGDTGLGTGTIALDVDAAGRPTAFFWRGDQSASSTPTEIAMGRPT